MSEKSEKGTQLFFKRKERKGDAALFQMWSGKGSEKRAASPFSSPFSLIVEGV
jgi:hypothetical protein